MTERVTERQPGRKSERPRKYTGPLHIDRDKLDPNFRYEWVAIYSDNPVKANIKMSQGWAPVPTSELDYNQDYLEKYGLGSLVTETKYGQYVHYTDKKNIVNVLCKIPMEAYQYILEDQETEIRNTERRMQSDVIAAGGDKDSEISTSHPTNVVFDGVIR